MEKKLGIPPIASDYFWTPTYYKPFSLKKIDRYFMLLRSEKNEAWYTPSPSPHTN